MVRRFLFVLIVAFLFLNILSHNNTFTYSLQKCTITKVYEHYEQSINCRFITKYETVQRVVIKSIFSEKTHILIIRLLPCDVTTTTHLITLAYKNHPIIIIKEKQIGILLLK